MDYKNIEFDIAIKQYEREFDKKSTFMTWYGLYLTVLSVLYALMYKGIKIEHIKEKAGSITCLYEIVIILAFAFSLVAICYFLVAIRFSVYMRIEAISRYSKWFDSYIKQNNIDLVQYNDFLKSEYQKGLFLRYGEAIEHNRAINDKKIGLLDNCKRWIIISYGSVLVEYILLIIITLS